MGLGQPLVEFVEKQPNAMRLLLALQRGKWEGPELEELCRTVEASGAKDQLKAAADLRAEEAEEAQKKHAAESRASARAAERERAAAEQRDADLRAKAAEKAHKHDSA